MVVAGIYRFLSFIFLTEEADSAVSVVVYADGRLPLQSAQSEQCDHHVMLPTFGCFAVVDNRGTPPRESLQDFQSFQR